MTGVTRSRSRWRGAQSRCSPSSLLLRTRCRPGPSRPRPLPADGGDLHRDRDALGRADRPTTPPHRLPTPLPHRRRVDHRNLHDKLPHRPTIHPQALPQGLRTPHLRRPPRLARRHPENINTEQIGRDDLLFTTKAGTPISRNSFRTHVWLPAVKASGLDFNVRIHDLRHAHASWLLAGGYDLKSVMDRLGHAQMQTTEKYLAPPRRRPTQPRRTQPNHPATRVSAGPADVSKPGDSAIMPSLIVAEGADALAASHSRRPPIGPVLRPEISSDVELTLIQGVAEQGLRSCSGRASVAAGGHAAGHRKGMVCSDWEGAPTM
jgi:Phage integrase family